MSCSFRKIVSCAVLAAVSVSLVPSVPARAAVAQTEQNSNAWYGKTNDSFNVEGIVNGNRIQTTFAQAGYFTKVQVGNNAEVRIPNSGDFEYGTTYTVNGVNLKIEGQLSGSSVLIKYSLENTTNSAVSVKVGSYADTQIGNNDSAAVSVNGSGLQMTDGVNAFLLQPDGTAFTTKWYGYYGDARNNVFVNRADTSTLEDVDSGVAWSWTVDLAASGTATRTAVFTIGTASSVLGSAETPEVPEIPEIPEDPGKYWEENLADEVVDDVIMSGDSHSASISGDFAIPYSVMKYLADNPEVTLNYEMNYQGQTYDIVIPAGRAIADINIPWYGPEWLIARYGNGGDAAVTGLVNQDPVIAEYVVVKDDNLRSIAAKLGTTLEDILSLNSFNNINLIYPGDVIRYTVPGTAATVTAAD